MIRIRETSRASTARLTPMSTRLGHSASYLNLDRQIPNGRLNRMLLVTSSKARDGPDLARSARSHTELKRVEPGVPQEHPNQSLSAGGVSVRFQLSHDGASQEMFSRRGEGIHRRARNVLAPTDPFPALTLALP